MSRVNAKVCFVIGDSAPYGIHVPVEAWNRDNTVRLETGLLTAVDNQIDQATGTAKLKAVFDNRDDSLFPNQFVNIRMRVDSR